MVGLIEDVNAALEDPNNEEGVAGLLSSFPTVQWDELKMIFSEAVFLKGNPKEARRQTLFYSTCPVLLHAMILRMDTYVSFHLH